MLSPKGETKLTIYIVYIKSNNFTSIIKIIKSKEKNCHFNRLNLNLHI